MEAARPSLDQYFMDMTHLIKSRGTCPRRQVGALIVKDKRVLTTGYNGAPRNFPHPTRTGCIRDELDIPSGLMADVCPCLHAEQNALLQAATTGVSIEGADLYCTTQPCTQCSRMIANCGIRRVIFEDEYADPLSIGLLVTAGVELWKWDAAEHEAHPYGNQNTWAEAQDELRERWRAGEVAPSDRPIADAEGPARRMAAARPPSASAREADAARAAHDAEEADDEEPASWQRPERARAPPAGVEAGGPEPDRTRHRDAPDARTAGATGPGGPGEEGPAEVPERQAVDAAGKAAPAEDMDAPGSAEGMHTPGPAVDTEEAGAPDAADDARSAHETGARGAPRTSHTDDAGAGRSNGTDSEVHVEGLRPIEGDPAARQIMRKMIEEREERLQRALSEQRSGSRHAPDDQQDDRPPEDRGGGPDNP